MGGGGDLFGVGLAAAPFRTEVWNFVFDEGTDESEVVAGGGEDAMPTFGVPASDALLELGRAVEVDFLGALDGPVLEDADAAG